MLSLSFLMMTSLWKVSSDSLFLEIGSFILSEISIDQRNSIDESKNYDLSTIECLELPINFIENPHNRVASQDVWMTETRVKKLAFTIKKSNIKFKKW